MTTVPVTSTTDALSTSNRPSHSVLGRTEGRLRASSGIPARWYSTIALASSTVETRKWPITNGGSSSSSTTERAEQDLGDEADHQTERQPHEVASPGQPDDRAEHCDDDRERDQTRDDAVRELDVRVRVVRCTGREVPVRAIRPVRATETGSSEPHRGTRDDDRGKQDRRNQCDLAIRARRDPEPTHGRAIVGAAPTRALIASASRGPGLTAVLVVGIAAIVLWSTRSEVRRRTDAAPS